MRLYLVRHGRAAASGPWTDVDRPLLPATEADLERAALGLARLGVRADVVAASPARRCRDTAEILARGLGAGPIHVVAALAPDGTPAQVLGELAALRPQEAALLVGHEPSLGGLAAALLRARRGLALRIDCGACIALDLDVFPPRGPAVLSWLLDPQVLLGLGEAPD